VRQHFVKLDTEVTMPKIKFSSAAKIKVIGKD